MTSEQLSDLRAKAEAAKAMRQNEARDRVVAGTLPVAVRLKALSDYGDAVDDPDVVLELLGLCGRQEAELTELRDGEIDKFSALNELCWRQDSELTAIRSRLAKIEEAAMKIVNTYEGWMESDEDDDLFIDSNDIRALRSALADPTTSGDQM